MSVYVQTDQIEAWVTGERLAPYRAATRDSVTALRLYEWNIAMSAAMLPVVSKVEIVVRNALDAQLRAWAQARRSASWLMTVPLDQRGRQSVVNASARAGRADSKATHGKVVAELPLGFWVRLCHLDYLRSLWLPALNTAFKQHPQRDLAMRRHGVERQMLGIMYLRNRIAHHEPVHHLRLEAYLDSAEALASWVHAVAGEWVGCSANSARRILAVKPC